MAISRAARWLTAFVLIACNGEPGTAPEPGETVPITEQERALLLSLAPDPLPAAPPDTSNAWAGDDAAAAFGQRLFFDPGFSGELLDGDNDGTANALGHRGETGKVSCAGCHVPADGFNDTRSIRKQVSLGAGWGLRKAPSLLDVGQSKLLMWDGRKDSLHAQPFGVLENQVEMNSSRLFAAHVVYATHRDEYESIFGPLPPLTDTARFPPLAPDETGCRKLTTELGCEGVLRGAPGDGAEYDGMAPEDRTAVTRVVVNVGKALGAYERLLTCGPSRFDQWIHGDSSALSAAEQRGALLFVGKARCIECHSGAYLSDEKFHNVGLKPEVVATVFLDQDDPGASRGFEQLVTDPLNVRGEFSDGDDGRDPTEIKPEHLGAFRTPRLRCVSLRPSFMHTAHVRTLNDVVAFFNRGGDTLGFLGRNELSPLGLTVEERQELVMFLEALEGPGPDARYLSAP